MAICECGKCGLDAGVYKGKNHKGEDVKGQPKRYIQGHSGVLHKKEFCARGHARTPDNVRGGNDACIACVKFTKLRNAYGITPEQKSEMLIKQGGCCAICREEFTSTPHVDHVHDETKRVRGLLCNTCNSAIGFLKENIQTLENAIQYLKETQCKTQQKPTSYVFSPIGPIHTGSGKSSAIGSLFLKAAAMA